MDDAKTRSLKDVEALLGSLGGSAAVSVSPASSPARTAAGGIAPERFRLFCDITRKIAQMESLADLLEQVLDAAILLTGAERGVLLLKDTESKSLALPGFTVGAAKRLQQKSLEDESFLPSLTAVRHAIEAGTTLVTDDAQLDPRFQQKKSIVVQGMKAILVSPLELSGKSIGALYLDHRYRIGLFSDEDVTLTEAFAAQAALAIQKARTLEDLRKAKQQLEARVGAQEKRIEELSKGLSRKELRYGYEEIIGQSSSMMKVLDLLDHVTETAIPVWIHGESGTGKELIARSLHQNSARQKGAFVAENVSAIPETLLESELFGHKKGAFTHADRDRIGLFEQANGGTLFLDEVADMSLPMQAKLLRVLQEGEVRPLGSSKKIKIDVRLVTASNQDIGQMVREKKFRQDLFFRINGLTVKLPPLRERKEDIPRLVAYLSKKIAGQSGLKETVVEDDALDLFFRYDWPGNVRELEAVLRNLVLFARGRPVTATLISERPELFPKQSFEPSFATPEGASRLTGDEATERNKILEALGRHGLDKKKAADDLGIALRTFYLRLEQLGLPTKKRLLGKIAQ